MKYSKSKFIASYVYYKLRIPFDVKVGWESILVAEFIWIFNGVLKTNFQLPEKLKRDYYVTPFGKFYVTPDLVSLVTLSPAFERLDTNELENLIKKELSKRKKVLVVDIGAYFGDYCIRIGNRFKQNKNLSIYAFEPGTEYLSSSTLEQLKKNIKINKLKNIKIFEYGIGSNEGINKLGIQVKPLNIAVDKNDYSKFEILFVKLDIDDYVIDGLKGIQNAVEKFNSVYLLVEDFVKPKETVKYLEKNNYKFIKKLTPYNSFWIKKNA